MSDNLIQQSMPYLPDDRQIFLITDGFASVSVVKPSESDEIYYLYARRTTSDDWRCISDVEIESPEEAEEQANQTLHNHADFFRDLYCTTYARGTIPDWFVPFNHALGYAKHEFDLITYQGELIKWTYPNAGHFGLLETGCVERIKKEQVRFIRCSDKSYHPAACRCPYHQNFQYRKDNIRNS